MNKLLSLLGWFKKPDKGTSPSKSKFGKPAQSHEIENLEAKLMALKHGLLANLKNINNDEY